MCPKDRAQMSLPFLGSYIWARNQAFDAWTHARSRRQCLDPLMECTPQAVRRNPQHLLRSSSGPSMRWYRLLRRNCRHRRLSCCCAARAVQAHTELRLAVVSAWAAQGGPGSLTPSDCLTSQQLQHCPSWLHDPAARRAWLPRPRASLTPRRRRHRRGTWHPKVTMQCACHPAACCAQWRGCDPRSPCMCIGIRDWGTHQSN